MMIENLLQFNQGQNKVKFNKLTSQKRLLQKTYIYNLNEKIKVRFLFKGK